MLNRLGRPERHVEYYDHWDGSRVVDFVGVKDPSALSPDQITESELTQIAASKHGLRAAFAQSLDLREPLWLLLEAQRRHVLPHDPIGKPGDFDIIAGELEGGAPRFDRIGVIEVKRSPVMPDGTPKNQPSGLGTTQVKSAAQLGFDRVLLVHFVLGPDESLATAPGKASLPDHTRAVRAVLSKVRRMDTQWERRSYGLLVIEWARGRGAQLRKTGAIASTLAAPPPAIKVDPERRTLLVKRLQEIVAGTNRPFTMMTCHACGRVACRCET